MKITKTSIDGPLIVEPEVYGDDRGFFYESWNKKALCEKGIDCEFVQDNHSRSSKGVLRGLHYQLGNSQDKLVRVVSGEVFDVAVDVRMGSPNFGKYVSVCISADNKRQFFIPKGFAHGFLVLSDSAEFLYKCSDYYCPQEEWTIAWDDPTIAVAWPLELVGNIQLSSKDASGCFLDSMAEEDLPVYEKMCP